MGIFASRKRSPSSPTEYRDEAKRCITEMYARSNEADDTWIAGMIEEIKEHADRIIDCCRKDPRP